MADLDDLCEKKVKIVLLGEARVGKTSIINRVIKDTFDYNCMSSTGASFSQKLMIFEDLDTKVNFLIWDTVGQEKYRSISKLFYRDAAIAILVFDITEPQSFEEIKKYWLNEIRVNTGGKCTIGLAANKSDLLEQAKIGEEEIINFANKEGLIFKFTSALSNTGITELIKELGEKYLKGDEEALLPKRESMALDPAKSVSPKKGENAQKRRKCC